MTWLGPRARNTKNVKLLYIIVAQDEFWTAGPMWPLDERAATFQMRWGLLPYLIILFCVGAHGQTTQGLISGRILNSVTATPIQGANIVYASPFTNLPGGAVSDASGAYFVHFLSTGVCPAPLT